MFFLTLHVSDRKELVSEPCQSEIFKLADVFEVSCYLSSTHNVPASLPSTDMFFSFTPSNSHEKWVPLSTVFWRCDHGIIDKFGHLFKVLELSTLTCKDFNPSSLIQTWAFTLPCWGTKIPRAARCGQKKKTPSLIHDMPSDIFYSISVTFLKYWMWPT